MGRSIWKKLILFSMAVVMLFGMSSCGRDVPLALGEKGSVENQVELTSKNVIVSPKVFAPISGPNPMGWVVEDEDCTYVTIITEIKNLSDVNLTMEDIWQCFQITVGEEVRKGTIVAALAANETKLDDQAVIKPQAAKTVYLITEVAKSELDQVTSGVLKFGKTTLKLELDTSKPVAVASPLKLKQDYKVKNLGKVTPKKVSFMEQLEPENPGYTYDYYVPKTDEDKLLVLTTKVKNTAKGKRAAYRYLNMMVYVDDEVYLGDIVAEDQHSANIRSGEKLSSGDVREVYAMVNLPKSVKKKDCQIYVYLNGAYYQYEMN